MDRRLEIGNVEGLQFRRWRLGLWDLRGKFWVLGNLEGYQAVSIYVNFGFTGFHGIPYPDTDCFGSRLQERGWQTLVSNTPGTP